MEHRFDTLARNLSSRLSRREAFWRLGGGLAAAFFASVRSARAGQACEAFCARCCKNLDPPPRGKEMAECITACHEGLGPCGSIPGTCGK